MILSVSRRTDIPAFYSDWFFNRIEAGYVDVRNPMNIHRVSRVKITPDVVDCIVFWSKNPKPMLSRLDRLSQYQYYFQFTLNPYDQHIEKEVPLKRNIFDTFRELSEKIGKERVIWRYDPILISDKIDVNYHIKYFEEIAKRISGYSERCVISFVDLYKKVVSNVSALNIREPNSDEIEKLVSALVPIAASYGFTVQSCAEHIDLSGFGISHGACIDPLLISHLIGHSIHVHKDKNQRKECGCTESIDVGEYNTCQHYCAYCYANFNCGMVSRKIEKHNPKSSLLIGELQESDIVKERKVTLLKTKTLFCNRQQRY